LGTKKGEGSERKEFFLSSVWLARRKRKKNNLTVDINPKLFSLTSPKLGGHEMVE
jgi:hypothetical protein